MSAPRSLRVLATLVVLIAASFASAQTPVLIKDIYPGFTNSRWSNVTPLNGVLYFTADDPTNGNELWRTDGTNAGTWMVEDINPGWASSNIENMIASGGKLYFFADNGLTGKEPWVSDGTAEGTFLLKDVRAGTATSLPGSNSPYMVAFADKAYMTLDDGVVGRELWISDGTVAGTQLFKDFNPAGPGCFAIAVAAGRIWLNGVKDNLGGELWKSDGTLAGTTFVADIHTAPGVGSSPFYFTEMNGIVYFYASGYLYDGELHRTDGTAAGTYMVKEIATNNATAWTSSSTPRNLTAVGNYLFFTADEQGSEGLTTLWRTDGTASGTIELPMSEFSSGDAITGLVNYNGTLLALHLYGSAQTDFWRSDGTAAGTYKFYGSGARAFGFVLADGLAFIYGGTNMLRTDGTAAGTLPYGDFAAAGLSLPSPAREYNGRLLVSARHNSYGFEPWTIALCNSFQQPVITAVEPEICTGGTGHASAQSGYATYSWSITNGTITTGQGTSAVTFTASGAGAVGLTLNVSSGPNACTGTATKSVPLMAQPVINASGPTTFCQGGSVTLTAPAGYPSYSWSTGATTQSITVSASGSYTVTVTNAYGCSSTSAGRNVTVNPNPATPAITASGPTSICEGGSVTLTAPAGYTYNWSTGATTRSITVSTAGSYIVTVTDANGCYATSAATSVTVNANPATPTIGASGPTTFCQGGSVTLTASAAPSYLWSNGATTQSITVSASGSYSVTVPNASGCTATSAATAVTVNPNPSTPSITPSGPTTFCEGGSVTLTAPAGFSYAWSNGATTQSITVSASGSYSVTVTNANGCSATSAPTSVTVHPAPSTPAITPSGPTTFCEGGSVTLSAPAGFTYAWSNGATTQSINATASGSYSVTVTNASGCSATSAPAVVTVNPLPATPSITPSGPTTFCEGASVTLTAPAGFSYTWSNGATTRSISVSTSGSYSVTVTNANGCSAASAPATVTVNPLPATPAITPSGPTTFCQGGSVTLSAPAGFAYAWSNGATTQSIVVAASGAYSVTVTNANGCSATSAPAAVTVNPTPSTPVITPSGPTTFCEGGSVTLTAPAGFAYAWSNGATTQSIDVAASGSYSVTVTNGSGCSATSAPAVVTVNANPSTPVITPSGPTTFCEGGSVTLSAPAGFSYAWSTGATTQSITVTASGSYSVTVTNAGGCSATSAPTNVTVHPAASTPTVTPSGATTFCEGGSVTLTASAGSGWLWSNGATTQSITVSASGSYSVTVTNENGCGATSAPTVVTVNANPSTPSITPSGATTFCEGGSVTLTAPAGFSYSWSNGATSQSIVVTASGSYSVTVTNASGCSAASAATNVTVYPAASTPSITPSGATTFCEGGSVTLTASGGSGYLWSNGATTQSITVSASGSYSVTVTNGNGCSATSAATNVTVNPTPSTPTITPSGATTFCEGGSVTLTAPVGFSYAWSNGATTQSIVVSTGGSYSVTVTNASGCSATSAPTAVTVNATPSTPSISASGPTTFCEGGSVTLTAPAGFSYAWSNGATTQSIEVTASGSYSVTVTNASGCSATSAPTAVTVNATPSAPSISASGPTTFCEGGSVTLTAPAGFSYAWSNGATTQSIEVTASGSYSVTVTNASGCSASSASTAVTVNATPSTPSITPSGPTTFCEGGSVTLTAPAGFSYAWSNGATTQSITVSASGSYSVTVTNTSGCSATSAPTNVTVNATPSAPSITAGGPTTFCEGGSVTLTAPAGFNYTWSNGATTQSIAVSATGSYSVTVTNASGCSATSAPTAVTVNATPATPSITPSGPTTFCEGGSVTLTAPAGFSYAWSNGATTQSIAVTASGSYSVTVSNASGCSATSAPATVTVHPTPSTPVITPSGPTTFCQGGSVTLTASAGAAWLWSNGATTQSITVGASGSFSVTVTDANGCSASSASTSVTVNPLPAAEITASSTTLCEAGGVTLTASAGASWLWSNGATTQSISVSTPGSYSVTVSDGACSNTSAPVTVVQESTTVSIIGNDPTLCPGQTASATATVHGGTAVSYQWYGFGGQPLAGETGPSVSVTVNNIGTSYLFVRITTPAGCVIQSNVFVYNVSQPDATVTASGPTEFCDGASVELSAPDGPNQTYLWSTGATSRSITVTTSGSYSVTVTNENGCSAASAPVAVTVHPTPSTPVITPSGPTSFCEGGSVTLSAPAGFTYLWSNGATTQSIAVSASGSYGVTVTNGSGCSATSAATNVTVNANPSTPAVSASGPTTFCQGGSVTLSAPSGFSYLWSNGATTQSIDVTASGSYSVTVTNGSGCSAASAATSVTVHATPSTPDVTASGPTTFCEGDSVTLSAPAGFTYLWSTGATTQSIDVTTSGSYSVTVTNGNGCSASSAATNVTVNANPSTPGVTASGPTTFCAGGSVTLTAPAGFTYLWSSGATTQSIDVTASGSYSVTVTNGSGCSATSAATNVIVNANPSTPSVTPSGPTTFCAGGSVTLTAPAGFSYLWSNGATTQSINATTSGSYSVTVTNGSGCSTTSAATNVAVNANPSTPAITPSGPTTFCQGGSVTLSAPAGFTYLWSTGATTQSINVTASGSYSVTVTNGSGCSAASAPTTVTVNTLPAQPVISGPTTFCPGSSITLSAPAGFSSYLWSTGATTQSISVSTAGNYTVTVANAEGCSRTSAVHAVAQNAATVITTQPLSFSMPRNATRTISVTATGTPTLQYQWYRGFSGDTSSPVVGATGSSYTFTLTKRGTYRYWVRVTSSTCTGSTVNSITSTITVN
jgi:large repetitive protein